MSAVRPYLSTIPPEDAIQIGWVAFLEAANRWNGVGTLVGFAAVRIHGAILDEVRRLNVIRVHRKGVGKKNMTNFIEEILAKSVEKNWGIAPPNPELRRKK